MNCLILLADLQIIDLYLICSIKSESYHKVHFLWNMYHVCVTLVKQSSASHGSFHLRKIKTQSELRKKYNLSVSPRLFSKYFLNFVI